MQDFVIGKGGSGISMAALNVHGPGLDNVLGYQFRRVAPCDVEFRMMVAGDFDDLDVAAIRAVFKRMVGSKLDVHLAIIPDIPVTGRGKLRRLITEIPGLG